MKNEKNNRWWLALLVKLLTHHEDHEQYSGDIEEMYEIHKKQKGAFGARFYLFKQVLRSVPYFIYSSVYWGEQC